ncbi:MAG: DEAD/DEAH box helicase family protein, partial [Candidatus Paceibacterota bacterium]
MTGKCPSRIAVRFEDPLRSITSAQMAGNPPSPIYEQMVAFGKVGGEKLFAHQRFAVDYAAANPRKSLLVCYATGTGKTTIAATIAVKHFHGKVVYMGPKILHSVFRYSVTGVGGDPRERMSSSPSSLRYATITSEASNVYDQMMAEVEPILGKIDPFDKRSPKPDERGEPIGEDPLVTIIMDECHIFSTRVAHILSRIHYADSEDAKLESQDKQAYRLYRWLCRDPRIRVIAMTATPIKTFPFNFVPIANIVRREFVSTDGKRSLAFPEVYGRFYDSFVTE